MVRLDTTAPVSTLDDLQPTEVISGTTYTLDNQPITTTLQLGGTIIDDGAVGAGVAAVEIAFMPIDAVQSLAAPALLLLLNEPPERDNIHRCFGTRTRGCLPGRAMPHQRCERPFRNGRLLRQCPKSIHRFCRGDRWLKQNTAPSSGSTQLAPIAASSPPMLAYWAAWAMIAICTWKAAMSVPLTTTSSTAICSEGTELRRWAVAHGCPDPEQRGPPPVPGRRTGRIWR